MKNLKQCSKCKKWKELSEFHKNKQSKDGIRSDCKKCCSKWQRKNYNPIKNKEYYSKNKNRIIESSKKYYSENKIKNKVYRKNYYYNWLRLPLNWWSISKFKNEIRLYEKIKKSNNNYLMCKCAYCGKWFEPTKLELQNRLDAINNINKGEGHLYCSNKCKKECPTYGQYKYPKGFKKATSREVQPELRQLVLKRDNYTCQKCGLIQEQLKVGLHCHHYEGIHWNPIESADIDACITLCKNCHKEVHKLPGCTYKEMMCNNNNLS